MPAMGLIDPVPGSARHVRVHSTLLADQLCKLLGRTPSPNPKFSTAKAPRTPRQTSWLRFLSSLRPLRLCVRKARSLAKIAKTNLLASVPFFFAPFASLREEGPVSRQDRKDRQEKPLLFSSASLPHQPARAISQCGTTHCPTPCHASEQVADCRAVEKGT